MKKIALPLTIVLIYLGGILTSANAQIGGWKANKDKKTKERIGKSKEAIEEFKNKDNGLVSFFNKAYGYVIFPSVGKGGIGVGGAHGKGIVYERGKIIGQASLTQASIGFQFGGQSYREVIFFETKTDLDRFKENKFEFSAQASAVAVTVGASADVAYNDGVAVFTMQIGGLMYEASIGGQKFKYTAF